MSRTMAEPYPGPRPFLREDRDRFFGRSTDAAALAGLWEVNRLTVATGPTASGKTSLLNAGVLPMITLKGTNVLPVGRISYGLTFPFAALPEHNPYTLALLRSWSPGEAATRLAGLSVGEFIRRRAERNAGAILAPVDQAEELLVEPGPRRTYRQQFLREIAQALRDEPRLHLLLVIREEALDVLSDVLGNGIRHRVAPLTVQDAFEAVTKPVAGTGRSYAPRAAEQLIADLQISRAFSSGRGEDPAMSDQVQPALLQVVCARLWEALPAGPGPITVRDVRMYADSDAALAAHYGRVIATVADDHDIPAGKLHSWVLRTFVTDHETRGTAYEGPAGTAGMPNAVARALEDRHLLMSQWRTGSRWYELLSERLIGPLRQVPDELPLPVKATEYLRAAERALTLGEHDAARRYAEAMLRAAPETDFRLRAEADSLLGNLAHEGLKAAEAECQYREAARLFEAARDTTAVAGQLAAVGQTLIAQGRLLDAVYELRAAVDRLPNDAVMQTELGLALWQLGDGRGAVAVLNDVLSVDGGNADALRARGEILADLGEARDALRDLDRLTLEAWPSARAARALALADLGDQAAANREIESAMAKAPRNGRVLWYGARTMERGGDRIAAEELARNAADAMDPPLPPSHREAALKLSQRENGLSAHD